MSTANPGNITPAAYSPEQAAVYTGLPYPMIMRLIKSGNLPHSKVGRHPLVRRAALDYLLHKAEQEAGDDT